jgi:hypothetical protein
MAPFQSSICLNWTAQVPTAILPASWLWWSETTLKNILSNPLWRALVVTLSIGALMALLDLLVKSGGHFWDGYFTEPDTFDYFCEETDRGALFRHKVNTYTNLAYLWGALWIFFHGVADRKKGGKTYLRRHPEWSILMGWACILVFVGSTLFHAGLTRWTEWADLAGVYAVALSIACMTAHRIHGLIRRQHSASWPFVLAWFVLWISACASIFNIRSWYLVLGAFLMIAIGGLLVLLLTKRSKSSLWYLASMLLTVMAVMFFSFDISRIFCDPKAWIQPHGNWHLCAAASFMLYYRFIRSSTATHAAL